MINDSKIKDDILNELEWNPRVDPEDIGVEVHDGAVTLTGHVRTFFQKLAAKQCAKGVTGVHALVDNIEVRLGSGKGRADDDIAEKIAHVLEWSVSIPNKDIQAEVKNGFVTLNGNVDWNYQRQNVVDRIWDIRGVTGVSNLIKVKTRASTYDIKQKIKVALDRHAQLEASKINIDVSGGEVTLSGTVESIVEMDRVEDAAWSATGVTKVVDNLRVAT